MLAVMRDPKMFWVMSLKASVSAWVFFECVMGTSTAQQQTKCPCVTNTLPSQTQNTEPHKMPLRKLSPSEPDPAQYISVLILRWEPWFIFDLEHYERKKLLEVGSHGFWNWVSSAFRLCFFLICINLIWMATRNKLPLYMRK